VCGGKLRTQQGKPWILQEMVSKMDGRRKWKTVNNEEEKTTQDGIMN
jgi:hypothetical protein